MYIFKTAKVWFVIALLVLVTSGCGEGGDTNGGNNGGNNDGLPSYAEAVRILSADIPTIIYVYGDELVFPETSDGGKVSCKKINELSEETLLPNDTAEHYVLVVNDIREHAPMTVEQVKLTRQLMNTMQYTVFYVGRRYNSLLAENGMWICTGKPGDTLDNQYPVPEKAGIGVTLDKYGIFSYFEVADDATVAREQEQPGAIGEELVRKTAHKLVAE